MRAAKDAAQDARQHALDLRERRLAGMAAELAAALSPGDPCRVCGSPEHPAPAEPAADRVTAEDERRARTAQHAAEAELAAATDRVGAVAARAAAAGAAAEGRTPDELAAEIQESDERRRSVLRTAEGWLPLGQQLEQLERDGASRREQQRQAGELTAQLAGQLGALDAELAALETRLAAARGDAPSVAARAAAVAALSAATTAVLDAARAAATARDHRDESAAALLRAARDAGFADLAALDAAALPPDELDALRRRFKQLDADLELADAQLADPALRAAAELPPAAAESARAAAARADGLSPTPTPPTTGPAAGSPTWPGSAATWPRWPPSSPPSWTRAPGSAGWPRCWPAPPPRTRCGCAWSPTCWPPGWSRSPRPRPGGC
ncbi:hypothetical protein [Kitasatospora sp. NA04385]|uniref:hypothetical protein n=1 Tax=Kitasatospora sp. NA04385 TaxID=2742135 RepID=UPI0034CEDCA1